jgi:predicted methyltransferase
VGYSVKSGIIFVENGHLRLTDKGREFAGKSVVEEFIV